jgi:predicted XRE-type DNA-binding protein
VFGTRVSGSLAVAINQILQGRKLSQTAALRRLKVNHPKMFALSNYQLQGFSVERLMNFLTALDRDVDIVIRRRPGTRKGEWPATGDRRDDFLAVRTFNFSTYELLNPFPFRRKIVAAL